MQNVQNSKATPEMQDRGSLELIAIHRKHSLPSHIDDIILHVSFSLFFEPRKIILICDIYEPVQKNQYSEREWESNTSAPINQRYAIYIPFIDAI